MSEFEIEDEEFLAAAMEAEALSSGSKRHKVSHSPSGAYIEALKGSKGTLFNHHSTTQTTNSLNLGFADSTTGTCFTCGKSGHWARDCHLKAGATSSVDVEEKQCPCGVGVCNVLTAKTERNCGRSFYRCPIRQESGGCGFFEWCNDVSGPEIVSEAPKPSAPELPCPCGAGSCLILTAKTEKNLGQQFYKCPATQGGCGFFKWCREVTATAGNLSSVYTSASEDASGVINKSYNSNNSSCFKCGKDGHFAKDCNQSSSCTFPTSQSTFIMSNKSNISSNSSCFKCGKDGHWARDCNQSSSNDHYNSFPTSQSTINTSDKINISSNSSCYKCGKDGHWAKDCNQSSSNDHSNRSVKTATSGSCFKCGNTGHWAKDCSSPSDTKAWYGQ